MEDKKFEAYRLICEVVNEATGMFEPYYYPKNDKERERNLKIQEALLELKSNT